MRELLSSTDWKWDFILNLSESDYPVKRVERLIEFLSANRNLNFVKSHGREVQRFIQKQGLDKSFVECDTHMWRIGDRALPWGIQIDGGSDWIALSKDFVSYVASKTPDNLVKGLFTVFKYTLLPAESFFHTVLRNSRFCGTYIDNNLHVTNWKRKLGCKCQYKHVVDWCGCSPNDFKPEDWPRIINTEPRQLFFARKFEPIINQEIILQLEAWLYDNVDFELIFNSRSYWHNIYHHLDLGTVTDDALLTIASSVARIISKSLSGNNCTIDPITVLEITSHHVRDNYKNTLVLFAINSSNERAQLEASFKPKTLLSLNKVNNVTFKLQKMSVASEYDQKEQISRNFARVLGPYSEPVLVYDFLPLQNFSTKNNVSFLWFDPAAHLADVSEVPLDKSTLSGHSKPMLRQPLLPGLWSIKIIFRNDFIAELKFLILPLEYFSGNSISPSQVRFVHSGSNSYRDFSTQWDKYLFPYNEQDKLERLSLSNSKRFGSDLREWIDSFVTKYYDIGEICVSDKLNNICGQELRMCNLTDWSSVAPDPKSNVNSLSGGANRFYT